MVLRMEVKGEATMSGSALQNEISFLNHRWEVIEWWPDSPRKVATRHAIRLRMEALGCVPGCPVLSVDREGERQD